MVNSELFRKIADRIEAEPKIYSQEAAIVENGLEGPCYCIGGLALLLSGHDLRSGTIGDYGNDNSARRLLGYPNGGPSIFDGGWKPREGLTVPQALRLIADGASVSEVSA
jgi:hypothetical protein